MSQTEISKKKELMATSIASPFAGMIAKFLLHPIDTIKAKVQVNRIKLHSVTDYKPGMALEIVRNTFINQGIPGFFRGVTISVFGSSIAFLFYMSAYQRTKHYLNSHYKFFQQYSSVNHIISGFIAQIVSCSLWLPIDIIKERMQVQSQIKLYSYKNTQQAFKKINKSEGIIGLYRAFGATLLFFGPFSAIFFASFQKLKSLIVKDRNKQTLQQSLQCSALAGAIAGYLTTPLQIVKLRMQIQRADVAVTGGSLQNSVFGYRNAIHGLSLMVKNQGFFSLFKGSFLRICFSMPITAISMTLTQYFKQQVLKKQLLLNYFI